MELLMGTSINCAAHAAQDDCSGFAGLTARFHRQLGQLFQMHQEALLIDDLTLALNVFDLFAESLHKHLDVEGNILLPLHRALVTSARWPLLIYEKEHDKLLRMAERVRRELLDLSALHGRARRLAVLTALDYQGSFKAVMEHHEQREEQAMLPELDVFVDSEIYRQAYSQVSLVWEKYLQDNEPHWRAVDDLLR